MIPNSPHSIIFNGDDLRDLLEANSKRLINACQESNLRGIRLYVKRINDTLGFFDKVYLKESK